MTKIKHAQNILDGLGLPIAQQNEISALTLIALCGIRKRDSWKKVSRKSYTITKGIMAFIKENYGKTYAPNTRETFRRQVLHQFVQGGIAEYNPDNPNLPTNSPNAHYSISDAALNAIRFYGTNNWKKAYENFKKEQGSLLEIYSKKRQRKMIPVRIPDGKKCRLSPGKHNEVQAAVIHQFAPRFTPGAKLLYLGDTAKKNLIVDEKGLSDLGLTITEHDKLPDIVFWDSKKDWLFLVEAVTSHGPMTPKRVVELERMLSKCRLGKIYVSAFPDFSEFRKHIKSIAWETEVWIAEIPDHLIHYNGDKFFGPR